MAETDAEDGQSAEEFFNSFNGVSDGCGGESIGRKKVVGLLAVFGVPGALRRRPCKSNVKKQNFLLQNAQNRVFISVESIVMSAVLQHINSAGGIFAGFALAMLIQSGVVIAVVVLAEAVLRKRVRAAVRYWLWMAVPVQLLVPVFLLLPLWWASLPASGAAVGRAGPLTWQGMLLLVWLFVAGTMAVVLLRKVIRARRLVARAKEVNNLMRGVLWYCRTCMHITRPVRFKVSDQVDGPVVCGLLRPVILVPHNLAPTLGARHLRSALLHELAHIRRGDLWANLAQAVLQALYFYNPLLWLANRRIRKLREQAVDEMVVKVMGGRGLWYPQARVDVSNLIGTRHRQSVRRTNGHGATDTVAGRS
ncbi:MAG: M56 family metallopeptidase, partial [Planctomycetota bacterium]